MLKGGSAKDHAVPGVCSEERTVHRATGKGGGPRKGMGLGGAAQTIKELNDGKMHGLLTAQTPELAVSPAFRPFILTAAA